MFDLKTKIKNSLTISAQKFNTKYVVYMHKIQSDEVINKTNHYILVFCNNGNLNHESNRIQINCKITTVSTTCSAFRIEATKTLNN